MVTIEFLNVWSGKIPSIEDYLKEEAKRIDIFCFQEADGKFPEICRRVLPEFGQYDGYKQVDKNDIFPQSVFVNNRVRASKFRTLLAEVPNAGLGLECQIGKGIRRMNLVNFHGISVPGNKLDTAKREEQSELLIKHFNGNNRRAIIGGDFNLGETTNSVRVFEEFGYRNLIKDFNIPTTRNRIIWDKYPETKQYFSDYVFVGQDIEVVDFKVIENEVSDHLPMVLTVK